MWLHHRGTADMIGLSDKPHKNHRPKFHEIENCSQLEQLNATGDSQAQANNHRRSLMQPAVPFFSVIIPTYNRPKPLAACLRSLKELAYPRDRFEVIVVDDGSSESLEPVVKPFRGQLDLTLLAQSNAGPATARNTGAARAKGDFLAFTDDDCAPASNWLTALAARFAAGPDCLIGGRTLNALRRNPYSAASQLLIDYLYSYYNSAADELSFFASNNLAMPTTCFHEVGGFDATFPLAAGEDREFCDRWRHCGYRLTYAPEAVIYHAHALTLRTFLRQHFNYGRGAYYFHRARAQRGQERIRVEPLPFYLKIVSYPFAQARGWQSPLLAALFVASQGANALGFWWERLNQPTPAH
jgi:glycosyltransferase involved in cell wall biosynthesis